MEKQQLRRAAEPLVGLWILGISCLPCGVCSIEIHFLSGTWDTSHIRYQLHHCTGSGAPAPSSSGPSTIRSLQTAHSDTTGFLL